MESLKGYKNLFDQIGFKSIKLQDVTALTENNWIKLYDDTIQETITSNPVKWLCETKNINLIIKGKKSIQIAHDQYAHFSILLFRDRRPLRSSSTPSAISGLNAACQTSENGAITLPPENDKL